MAADVFSYCYHIRVNIFTDGTCYYHHIFTVSKLLSFEFTKTIIFVCEKIVYLCVFILDAMTWNRAH